MLDFVYTKSPVIAECNNKVITRKKYKKLIEQMQKAYEIHFQKALGIHEMRGIK